MNKQDSQCVTTYIELEQQFGAVQNSLKYGVGIGEAAITELEKTFKILFPDEYRHFLLTYGYIAGKDFYINGVENYSENRSTLATALINLKVRFPGRFENVVPIEDFGNGRLACLDLNNKDVHHSPIVEIDIFDPGNGGKKNLAICFNDFLINRLQFQKAEIDPKIDDPEFADAWFLYEKHVLEYQKQFGYNHRTGGKLPRKFDWRPFRFCVQDVVLGLLVIKHSRKKNRELIDVFLTASIPEYEQDSGVRALALIMLSEAYMSGGTMEIQFSQKVEGGKIPKELVELAQSYGINFANVNKGIIVRSEAEDLYMALTGFEDDLNTQIQQLSSIGSLSISQVCFSIHRGLWDSMEVEAIIETSINPGALLSGINHPELFHLYMNDVITGRAVLLFGNLERTISSRLHETGENLVLLQDDIRSIRREFLADDISARFESKDEEINLSVFRHKISSLPLKEYEIKARKPFRVIFRGRDLISLSSHLHKDIEYAIEILKKESGPVFIMYPRDIDWVNNDLIKEIPKDQLKKIGILAYQEFSSSMDLEITRRLGLSYGMRQ